MDSTNHVTIESYIPRVLGIAESVIRKTRHKDRDSIIGQAMLELLKLVEETEEGKELQLGYIYYRLLTYAIEDCVIRRPEASVRRNCKGICESLGDTDVPYTDTKLLELELEEFIKKLNITGHELTVLMARLEGVKSGLSRQLEYKRLLRLRSAASELLSQGDLHVNNRDEVCISDNEVCTL